MTKYQIEQKYQELRYKFTNQANSACNPNSPEITKKNQYRCMAKSLRDEIKRCDSYHKGLAAYTSGRCELKGRPKWVVLDREKQKIRIMKKVEEKLKKIYQVKKYQ